MGCSDYPHFEGTDTPLDDYRTLGMHPEDDPSLFHDNAAFLLRR